MSLIQFFTGLLTPYLASVILVLGVRHLAGQGSINLTGGAVVVAIVSVIATVILWGNYRWISYGLIAAVSLAMLVSGAWCLSHTNPGAPPP